METNCGRTHVRVTSVSVPGCSLVVVHRTISDVESYYRQFAVIVGIPVREIQTDEKTLVATTKIDALIKCRL